MHQQLRLKVAGSGTTEGPGAMRAAPAERDPLEVRLGALATLLERVAAAGFDLRIAGGLALIAAVVAEFAAGTAGGNAGLAFRLLESQFRLNIPRLFAALVLLSLTGVVIYAITSLISYLLLRKWHESAVRREN